MKQIPKVYCLVLDDLDLLYDALNLSEEQLIDRYKPYSFEEPFNYGLSLVEDQIADEVLKHDVDNENTVVFAWYAGNKQDGEFFIVKIKQVIEYYADSISQDFAKSCLTN